MTRILRILAIMLFVSNAIVAQNPSDTPCNAPTVQVNNTPGTLISQQISVCCNNYTNFLNAGPTCGTAQTNRDAWYKIQGLNAGEQYNFMYIETGNRQTWIEIFELPAGKNCNLPGDYKSVKCARANNVAFYPGSTVSATFIPPSATSTYYARFQRLNVTDEVLEGAFSVTKSYPNEEPCGATLLQTQPAQGTAPTFGNNITAADWKPEILTGPLCGANNDVWYKFVATTCSMQIFVDNLSQNIYEMQAALLTSKDGSCNNLMDVTPCGGLPDQYLDIMLTADNLTIGKTYYVIVDGYAPPYINAVGNFSIEVFEKPNAPACPKIASPCECDDALTCGGTVLPNSAAGNAALNAAANNSGSNGCFNFAQNTPPAPALCGGSNTVEFCTKYTATATDTLIAFDNIVHKDATCEVLSTKNIAYEEGLCGAPIAAVCLDYNKKSPVYKVTSGKTYRFCRQVVTNGADLDCLGKTYESFCAFLWKIPSSVSIKRTICNGESITIGSNTYNQSGQYSAITTSTTGCDSTVNLTLTVLPASNTTIDRKICNGDTYKLGSQTLDKSGTYTEKFKSGSNGCDSTVTLNLAVLPAKIVDLKQTICNGSSLTIGGKTFNQTGKYAISIKSNDGLNCDSTIMLDLTVATKIQTTNKITICNARIYTSPNGKIYDKTGKYDEVFKSIGGCDSTYTTDLTVLPVLSNAKSLSLCKKELPYKFGNQTITKEGDYSEIFKTKIGCDSTVTLKVTVTDTIKDVSKIKACGTYTWAVNNATYTTSGKYEKYEATPNGCGKLSILDLTINKVPAQSTINAKICEGESYDLFGVKYLQPLTNSIVVGTGKAQNGCDSTVSLTLKVNPRINIQESRSICNGQSVVIDGKTYDKAGTFTVFSGKSKVTGCDSTFTVSISEEKITATTSSTAAACGVTPPNGSVSVAVTGAGNFTYKWDATAKNATTTTVTGLGQGSYVVTVTSDKGCKVTQTATVGQSNPSISTTPSQAEVVLGGSANIKVTFTPLNGVVKVSPDANITKNADGTYTIKVTKKESTTYTFTVTDANGCTATATATVAGKFDIPSVFLPEGDGNVDEKDKTFTPVADPKLAYTQFLIFNRWSEIVYDNPTEHKWNGNYKGEAGGGNSKKCPADVYFYKIQLAGSEEVLSGQVTLMR